MSTDDQPKFCDSKSCASMVTVGKQSEKTRLVGIFDEINNS